MKLNHKILKDAIKLSKSQNKIYYYQKWNSLVIVYEDANVSPYELSYIGEFEEDVSEYLQEMGRNIFVEVDAE